MYKLKKGLLTEIYGVGVGATTIHKMRLCLTSIC